MSDRVTKYSERLKGISLPMLGVMAVFGLGLAGFLLYQSIAFLAIPFVALAAIWGVRDFRLLYLLLWATLPFSIEMDLPGGFSTDFPIEPLMWLCCLMLIGYLFLRSREIDFRFIYHPLFILLLIHFSWIIITSITSQEPANSIKFTLAKSWYLICFVLIPLLLLKKREDYMQWAAFLFIPLVLSILVIMYRHSQLGFSFSTINDAVMPIYRNHVDYACALGLLLPFAVWIWRQTQSGTIKWMMIGSIAIMVIGIYLSYTRAAWLCIPLAIGGYYLIRFRLMRLVIPLAIAGMILLVSWMAYDNRYIDFSPDYEKAVTHQKIGDLLSATTKMEDISTVERFYRWVAGYYMIQERPWLGFGPSSFYEVYHSFVDRHFTTYVSDNPEHSGIHNYYLMTAVEQGLIGLFIFLLLIIAVLLIGEHLYHQMRAGPERHLLVTALVSFCCSLFIMTLNDTVETDKLGTFFFLCIAIVIQMHILHRTQSKLPTADGERA
jgi:O-antigen ligase